MEKPQVLYVADKIDHAPLFQEALATLDVEVQVGSSLQLSRLLSSRPKISLLIFDATDVSMSLMGQLVSALQEAQCQALLLIVSQEQLTWFVKPEGILCDVVVDAPSTAECSWRIAELISAQAALCGPETIVIDDMEINLSTYQVSISEEPVDLTYLEYALLAFLITHPGQTYSRDALLQHVWGIDYFGGSRTVDVHVRRVRSKLGPDLAQHLETVRGVGYLWSA